MQFMVDLPPLFIALYSSCSLGVSKFLDSITGATSSAGRLLLKYSEQSHKTLSSSCLSGGSSCIQKVMSKDRIPSCH